MRHIGRHRVHLESTDSTNTRAAEYASDPANAGLVVTADLQGQGRGQYGRVWQSPPGANVLLSALVFPPKDLRRPAILTGFAAVAVAETVRDFTGLEATIKWPNDVLVEGKKICGILIEGGVRSSSAGPYFVIGIGLNVNLSAADVAAMVLPDATSLLLAVGRPLDVPEVTQALIKRLDEGYGRLFDGDRATLELAWINRLDLLGRTVAIELMDGHAVEGCLTELSFDELILDRTTQFKPQEVRHLRSIA